jgi:hypothetical protein
MVLPYYVPRHDDVVKEERAVYRVNAAPEREEIFPKNFLRGNQLAA